jgi:5-methylcytosine-specific restriction endonuclease McrA
MEPLNSKELRGLRMFFDIWGEKPVYPPGHKPKLPRSVRDEVRARFGGRCVYCSIEVVGEHNHPRQASVDHVMPVVAGGSDDPENLVLSCRSCNSRKGTRPAAEFRPHAH